MLQAQARTGAQSVYAPDLVAQPWQHVCKTPAHTCVIERRLPRLRLFPPTQRSTGPRRPKTKTKVEAGAGARHRSHRSLQQIVTGRCCREQCPRPSRPPRSHEFMRLIRPPGPCMPSPMTPHIPIVTANYAAREHLLSICRRSSSRMRAAC